MHMENAWRNFLLVMYLATTGSASKLVLNITIELTPVGAVQTTTW